MALFKSLRARVSFWVSVALIALFAVTIVGLDVIFRNSNEYALRDELQVQLLGLIAAAEESEDEELSVPDEAITGLLTVPESGVYGIVWDADGVPVWRSSSWLGRDWDVETWPAPGERLYVTLAEAELPALEGMLMGIRWDFHDGSSLPLTFGVAVSQAPYAEREAEFRRNLIGWFAAVTVTMLIVLTGLLSYVLKPLRRLVTEVGEVETGRRREITGPVPSELTGLTRNLNLLIDSERRRSVRYRNTLDDLAHSLKTPLAAIRALLTERAIEDEKLAKALDQEVSRMDQRIGYQLRRARATGGTGLGVAPVALAPVVEDIVGTLDKVYRDKQVSCELDVDSGAEYQGDPGDLSEILGNLLDNAYKYCRQRVSIEVRNERGRVRILVHDDGPGLPPAAVDALLERGARADESVPGQGIGLAVVAETAELYDGSIAFGKSPLGGAEVRVTLPRRRPAR
jgi:two-component system sensor histidine kinase PhoQ